jgi:hypothetical protein
LLLAKDMVRDFVVAGDSKEIKGKEVIKMPFGNGTGPMGLGPIEGGLAFVTVLVGQASPVQCLVIYILMVTAI